MNLDCKRLKSIVIVTFGICCSSIGLAMPDGFSLTSNLGYHNTTGNIASNDNGSLSGFAFDLGGDYRLSSGLALGANYFRFLFSVSDENKGSLTYSGFMVAPRYYFPLDPVVILGEIGIGWSWLTFAAESGGASFGFEASGPALSAGVAALYPVLPRFSVGVFTRLTAPFFTKLCANLGDGEQCQKPTNTNMSDFFYGVSLVYFTGNTDEPNFSKAGPADSRPAAQPRRKKRKKRM
jgi:hypothetical protein